MYCHLHVSLWESNGSPDMVQIGKKKVEENHDTKIKEQDKIYTFQLICCGSSR